MLNCRFHDLVSPFLPSALVVMQAQTTEVGQGPRLDIRRVTLHSDNINSVIPANSRWLRSFFNLLLSERRAFSTLISMTSESYSMAPSDSNFGWMLSAVDDLPAGPNLFWVRFCVPAHRVFVEVQCVTAHGRLHFLRSFFNVSEYNSQIRRYFSVHTTGMSSLPCLETPSLDLHAF